MLEQPLNLTQDPVHVCGALDGDFRVHIGAFDHPVILLGYPDVNTHQVMALTVRT